MAKFISTKTFSIHLKTKIFKSIRRVLHPPWRP